MLIWTFTCLSILGKENESARYCCKISFVFHLKVFYKTAELGGYMGAREADAEAWGK